MNDISSINGSHKLASQVKVSLETTQKQPSIEGASHTQEIKQFELHMEQINHAFALVKEIRASLESSLRELS
jgi:hypothetical protein